MATQIPINTEILKWARTSLGFSIDDVAKKMNKTSDIILEWENGLSSPTYPQLEKLAYKIYKRPIAVFFFPDVPEEDTPETDFRTLPGVEIEKLPPNIIKQYRKVKLYQIYLKELYEGAPPVPKNLVNRFTLDSKADIVPVSQDIRKILNISLAEQFKWRNADKALKVWRNAIENTGIFIFKDAFENDDYSGLCVHHKLYPVILINNSLPKTRQLFTLFHEIGHLLQSKGGIDFRSRRITKTFRGDFARFEMLSNRFANEFLVPTSSFQKENLIVSETTITELAIKYSVSREVILRNYLDRGLVDNYYYQEMADKWIEEFVKIKAKKKEKNGGGNTHLTKKAYLGENYINLVFSKFYQGKISNEVLSEYLGVKTHNIAKFEDYAFR